DNETGDPLIRAGAPDGWTVRDKSGHSDAIQNDIAVVTPPDDEPIVLTVLTEADDPDSEDGPALVAAVAEAVLHSFDCCDGHRPYPPRRLPPRRSAAPPQRRPVTVARTQWWHSACDGTNEQQRPHSRSLPDPVHC